MISVTDSTLLRREEQSFGERMLKRTLFHSN